MATDLTISERLALHGVTHEPGDGNGRRYLKHNGRSIGTAHASEAVALIELLDALAQPKGDAA
jgi:hypothetical protein